MGLKGPHDRQVATINGDPGDFLPFLLLILHLHQVGFAVVSIDASRVRRTVASIRLLGSSMQISSLIGGSTLYSVFT
jgi:hypothetical protein